MNKCRYFSLFLFFLVASGLSGFVAAGDYIAGRDFQILQIPVYSDGMRDADEADGKIEVNLILSHGCARCNEFIPLWQDWLLGKSAEVKSTRSYVSLDSQSNLLVKAVWLAEQFGVSEAINSYLYDVANGYQSGLESEQQLIDLFSNNGVIAERVKALHDHTQLVQRQRNAVALGKICRTETVPAIIINGYYVTDLSSARTPDILLEMADLLVEKERLKNLTVQTEFSSE